VKKKIVALQKVRIQVRAAACLVDILIATAFDLVWLHN